MAPRCRPTKPPSNIGLEERRSSERYLWLIGFLAALVMASEAGAETLSSRSFAAGDGPLSVAVADLDRDSVPEIVTGNDFIHDLTDLLGKG